MFSLWRARLPVTLNFLFHILSPAIFPPRHLPHLPIIQPPNSLRAAIPAHRTPHGGSLILKRCPPPLAPPAADSRLPPSASTLLELDPSASVVLPIRKPCSSRPRPHLHEAASMPVSPLTQGSAVCSVVTPAASSSRLHPASSASTMSSR